MFLKKNNKWINIFNFGLFTASKINKKISLKYFIKIYKYLFERNFLDDFWKIWKNFSRNIEKIFKKYRRNFCFWTTFQKCLLILRYLLIRKIWETGNGKLHIQREFENILLLNCSIYRFLSFKKTIFWEKCFSSFWYNYLFNIKIEI